MINFLSCAVVRVMVHVDDSYEINYYSIPIVNGDESAKSDRVEII